MIKIIISIVSLALAGGVFFMYTEAAYSNTTGLKEDIVKHDQALEKAAELKKQQETLLSRFNAFEKGDVERLHKLLPDHVDNVRLILDLDHLAGAFGMAVQNVVVSRSASESVENSVIGSIGSGKQKYDSLTLKFTTHGTYSNFIAFMESLESSLRIVDLIALNISPEGQGNRSVQGSAPAGGKTLQVGASSAQASGFSYKYEITIRTYWLR